MFWNVDLHWVKLRIFFWSFVHFYESFMLINELVNFIKVNPVSLVFCYHANYQVKKFLHWNWQSWFYVGWNAEFALSKQCHILFVVIVLLKDVRMTLCDHLEKNDSQRKNIAFRVCVIIRLCKFLKRHIIACTQSIFVKFHIFVKDRKPKISQFVIAIMDKNIVWF